MRKEKTTAGKIGKAASLCAGACTVLFGLLIILGFFIGTILMQCLVCLLLALSFVAVTNALYSCACPERKIWGRIAVSFSVMYAVYICLVYYSQLTVVRLGTVPADSLRLIGYAPGTWLFAVDMLGYGLLALSTLGAAFMFEKGGADRTLRVLLLIHGALAVPVLLFPALPLFASPDDVQKASFGGAVALLAWCLIFTPICLLLARFFSTAGRREE